MNPDYPFTDPYWNVKYQKYCCRMWGFGFRNIHEPFLTIIKLDRCNTFEQEYLEWLEIQQNKIS